MLHSHSVRKSITAEYQYIYSSGFYYDTRYVSLCLNFVSTESNHTTRCGYGG